MATSRTTVSASVKGKYVGRLDTPRGVRLELARVYTEAIRRIPKEPTRAKLRKAIDGLDEVSVGGFRVHFAQDRVASRLVELSLIDSQGKIRE